MAYLALVRHGESEWNALGIWTGWTDVSLTDKGRQEAQKAAEHLRGIKWDAVFVSGLKRSVETLEEIKKVLALQNVAVSADLALNERDYGNFTGLKKAEVEKKYGRDLFNRWRRGWDYPLPHGETLKDVYRRVVPYYETEILPLLKRGKNVIVSAHGNSLRALVKYLDNISDKGVSRLEIKTGGVILYQVDASGRVTGKEIKG